MPDVQMRLTMLPAFTLVHTPLLAHSNISWRTAEHTQDTEMVKQLICLCLLPKFSLGVQSLPYVILQSMRNQTEVAILTPFIHTSYFYTDRCKICKV